MILLEKKYTAGLKVKYAVYIMAIYYCSPYKFKSVSYYVVTVSNRHED